MNGTPSGERDRPALSVVVPTRDRRDRLRACLGAIGRAAGNQEVEVVIADDGESVDPAEAADWAGGITVRSVDTGGRGPAAARNAGAGAARAGLLAFTDDDCEPGPDWAGALITAHAAAPTALLGGLTLNVLTANPYSRAAQTITDAALAVHNGGGGGPRFFPSSNIGVPAAEFAELGGFDESFPEPGGEDRDFCERWIERGLPIVSAPGAVVEHSHPLGLRSFWRQQSAYGAGAFRHRSSRASRSGNRRRLEPSLTSGVLTEAARRSVAERDPGRLALLGVWQAANLAGFLGAALSRSEPS